MDRKLVNILGYGVDTFTFNEAVDYIISNHGQVVTINPEMIEYASNNSEFSEIINNAELVVSDGIGIKLGLKILGYNVERIPGIDFGKVLIEKIRTLGKTVAFVGATQDVVEKAVANLQTEMQDLNIVYWHNGYFNEPNNIYDELIAASPDLVLVALGSPKQEFFIKELKSKLPDAILIGLGGSFDVWAGAVKRAPKMFRVIGCEWLYRLISDPRRFKRIFPTLPMFIYKVIKERFLNN